jgi:hypothetical protein
MEGKLPNANNNITTIVPILRQEEAKKVLLNQNIW